MLNFFFKKTEIDFSECKNIFIDFDGVLVKSNKFKEKAIEKSILKVVGNTNNSRKAIKFFNEYAGIGRKTKLKDFFEEKKIDEILNEYNYMCLKFLKSSKPTFGSKLFLQNIKKYKRDINIFILSGGEKEEIMEFLKRNKISHIFTEILYSNFSKTEHLYKKNASVDDIFFGDSKTDLMAARDHSVKFIHINGFVSPNSKPEITTNNQFLSIKNFSEIKIRL